MLTEKQQAFFELLERCYQEEKEFPSIGLLKKKSNYKSYNTIYKYLNQLEKKGYLKFDRKNQKIIYIRTNFRNNNFLKIPLINENKFLEINKDYLKETDYVAYQLHDNRLKSQNILNKDILIIEKSQQYLENKLVLVYLNNKYLVLKYNKKDGFIHLQNDKENYILVETNKIIGKVVSLIRPSMD